MRQLTEIEVEQVSGGFLPIIGAVISVVGHFGARTLLGSLAGRAGLIFATYELAKMVKRS